MSIETTMHVKRLCAQDCIERASEALEGERARGLDWQYVYDQLTKAQEVVINALLLKHQVDQAEEDELSDTPLVPQAGHASTNPEDYTDYPGNGGDA